MKKGWFYLAFAFSIFLLHPGCTCHKYHIHAYLAQHPPMGPEMNPFPIIVENDSLKAEILFEKGQYVLKKNQELRLLLLLRSEQKTQQLAQYTYTKADLEQKSSHWIAQKLKIELAEGIGQIWIEGKKVNTRSQKIMELVGHTVNIVFKDTITADKWNEERLKYQE